MKLVDQSLHQFILQVASSSPAPGGGSIAALQGACGVALTNMALELTVSKKKFQSFEPALQEQIKATHAKLQPLIQDFITCIDEDTEAFNLIMKAFSLPKATESEKQTRKQAILAGTYEAIAIPKKVIATALEALSLFEIVFPHLNQNTLSDQGVAILCLATAIEGAAYNVLINLPSLTDENEKALLKDEAYQAILKANQHRSQHFETILDGLFQSGQ